ncbi:MAG: GNAT family N-acetyltransferase [Acidimicrobiales bacterium]
MKVAVISAEQTRPLRHLVLRPTQPVESTVYAGDDAPETTHLGAFEDVRLVGIASLFREPRAGGPADGWRLRGMATAPTARGRGAGNALLAGLRDQVAARGGGELWGNARQVAVGFYTAAGFEAVGPEFEIEDIGPHVVVRTDVPPSS